MIGHGSGSQEAPKELCPPPLPLLPMLLTLRPAAAARAGDAMVLPWAM